MRKTAIAVCLTLLVCLLMGCQEKAEDEQETSASFHIQTTTLNGDVFTSADITKNKLTVMNVWATWCPPCVAELPHLQKVSEAFQDEGVAVIGVLQDGVTELGKRDDQAIESANVLLDEAGAEYPILLPDDALQYTFIRTMQCFPTTFFLDGEGNLIQRVEGARDYEGWSELIRKALEEVDE